MTKITTGCGIQQIVIRREFDTAPEIVFKAHIGPELSIQWHDTCRPARLTSCTAQLDQVPHIPEV